MLHQSPAIGIPCWVIFETVAGNLCSDSENTSLWNLTETLSTTENLP